MAMEPPHAIYLRWGKLHLGVLGIPAVIVTALVLGAVFGRSLGLW